jgi:hypothetical protein
MEAELRPMTEVKCVGGLVSYYKLDIFRKLPDGQFLWVKAVEGLEEAKRQLFQLTRLHPGEYFIYDSLNGRRVDLPFGSLA